LYAWKEVKTTRFRFLQPFAEVKSEMGDESGVVQILLLKHQQDSGNLLVAQDFVVENFIGPIGGNE